MVVVLGMVLVLGGYDEWSMKGGKLRGETARVGDGARCEVQGVRVSGV